MRYADIPSLLKSIQGGWLLKRSIRSQKEIPDNLSKYITANKIVNDAVKNFSSNDYLKYAQLETKLYLKNQLLKDSDWASMANSLELRTPLVDIFLLNGLSKNMHQFINYKNKSLLSNSAKNPLPENIRNIPKKGFTMPIIKWLNIDNEVEFNFQQRILKEWEKTL